MRNGAEEYGPGKGPIFVQFTGSEQCTGSESRLLDCDIRPLGFPSVLCNSHTTDAAVICGKYLLIYGMISKFLPALCTVIVWSLIRN